MFKREPFNKDASVVKGSVSLKPSSIARSPVSGPCALRTPVQERSVVVNTPLLWRSELPEAIISWGRVIIPRGYVDGILMDVDP